MIELRWITQGCVQINIDSLQSKLFIWHAVTFPCDISYAIDKHLSLTHENQIKIFSFSEFRYPFTAKYSLVSKIFLSCETYRII